MISFSAFFYWWVLHTIYGYLYLEVYLYFYAEPIDHFMFLMEFWGSLIISSANRDNLTCFPICGLLIFCLCLIVLTRASSTILKRNRYFSRFCFVFLAFRMMLSMSLLCWDSPTSTDTTAIHSATKPQWN